MKKSANQVTTFRTVGVMMYQINKSDSPVESEYLVIKRKKIIKPNVISMNLLFILY